MSQNSLSPNGLPAILGRQESTLLSDWIKEQATVQGRQGTMLRESELRKQCTEFIGLLRTSLEQGKDTDIETPQWKGVREMLADLSQSRIALGFSPSETASFIFSLKRPVFASIRRELPGDSQAQADATWSSSELLDKLGLYTTEIYQSIREEIIGASSRR